MGYNLVIVKENAEQNPAIEEFVHSKIPNAKCISHVSAELTFQLPISELPLFKDLFTELDSKLKEFKIASYGISITTLEEVFLRVAEGNDPSKNLKFDKKKTENDEIDDFNLASVKIKGKTALFFVHFWALFVKRLQYFKRDKKGLFCELLLPCIIIVVGLCLTFIQFIYTSPQMIMSPAILNLKIQTPVQNSYSWFYNSQNFPGNYHDFLTSAAFDNNDINQFDVFEFQSRFRASGGIYGAYFITNASASHNYSYLAFVIFFLSVNYIFKLFYCFLYFNSFKFKNKFC